MTGAGHAGSWWYQAAFVMAVFFVNSAVVEGLERQKPVASRAVVSSSQRFTVSGIIPADNVRIAVWMEQLAERFQDLVGAKVPFKRGDRLHVTLRINPRSVRGSVVKSQGWFDNHLQQRLTIVNLSAVDHEDIIEGFTWLLLNRYVIRKQNLEERRRSLVGAPEWLSVGLAQNLYPETKDRNQNLILGEWKSGKHITLAEVTDFHDLPEGRWIEKSQAGLAVSFLDAQGDFPGMFEAVVKTLSRKEPLPLDRLARMMPSRMSVEELENAWQRWITRDINLRDDLGLTKITRIVDLENALRIRPKELGFCWGEGIKELLIPSDFIALYREPGIPALASRVALRIQSLAIGQAPEFQAVTGKYAAFFNRVSLPKRSGKKWNIFSRGASPKELTSILNEASVALEALKRDAAMKNDYLNKVEQDPAGTVFAFPSMTPQEKPSKMDVQRYLDRFESR